MPTVVCLPLSACPVEKFCNVGLQGNISHYEEYEMVTYNFSPALKRETTQLWKREEISDELKWLEALSPLHFRLCLVELHDAVSSACITEDWETVANLIEDWEATAQLDSNPELAKHLMSESLEYEDLDPSDLD